MEMNIQIIRAVLTVFFKVILFGNKINSISNKGGCYSKYSNAFILKEEFEMKKGN